MHIRTNIETNVVHLAVLAMCPLLLFINTIVDALVFLVITTVCFLVSTMICSLLNQYLSKPIKIFVTAMISTVLVTILNFVLSKLNAYGLASNNAYYFAVLSCAILCIEIYYINTKALVGNILIKIFLTVSAFASIIMIYSIPREIFGNGSFLTFKISGFEKIDFFSTMAFDLIWLGILCAVAELVYGVFVKWYNNRKISYQKLIKMVRNEREFQYDKLRRKKLLASSFEMNHVDSDTIKNITDRSNENLTPIEQSEDETTEEVEEVSSKRKNRKLKFSKETKEEKVYDKKQKLGEDNK